MPPGWRASKTCASTPRSSRRPRSPGTRANPTAAAHSSSVYGRFDCYRALSSAGHTVRKESVPATGRILRAAHRAQMDFCDWIGSVAGCARISPRTRTLRDDPESARAIAGAVDLAFSWLVADPHPETVPLGAGHSSRRPHKSDASECGADARNRDVPNATAAEGRSRSEPASRLRSSRIAPGDY